MAVSAVTSRECMYVGARPEGRRRPL